MCEWTDGLITERQRGSLLGQEKGKEARRWRTVWESERSHKWPHPTRSTKAPHLPARTGDQRHRLLFCGERVPLAGVVGAPRVASPGRRLRHRTGERGYSEGRRMALAGVNGKTPRGLVTLDLLRTSEF